MATKTYEHPLDISFRAAVFAVVFGALFIITLIIFVVTACLGELTTARYILLTVAGALSAAGVLSMGWYSDAINAAFFDHQRAAAELEALAKDEESRAETERAAVWIFSLYVSSKKYMWRAGSLFTEYCYAVVHSDPYDPHHHDPYHRGPYLKRRYGPADHPNYFKLAIDQLRADCGL